MFLKQTTEENFKILAAEKDITILRGLYKLNGKVDIILNYKDRVMVIDYKTGSTELDLKDTLLDAGLNLQNLIYFILIKNKYPESLFGGTYRYKVKPKITKFTKDNISLREGYTSSEEIVLKNIYKPNYKKLNIKQDGTLGSRSHTFSDEQFEEKLQKVEEKIFEFIKSIEEQKKYPAKPLKNSKVDSCKYCSYQELCYKAKQDYQYLK